MPRLVDTTFPFLAVAVWWMLRKSEQFRSKTDDHGFRRTRYTPLEYHNRRAPVRAETLAAFVRHSFSVRPINGKAIRSQTSNSANNGHIITRPVYMPKGRFNYSRKWLFFHFWYVVYIGSVSHFQPWRNYFAVDNFKDFLAVALGRCSNWKRCSRKTIRRKLIF